MTGDIGVSPIGHTALTGFSETLDSTGRFSTSTYVVPPGKLYAADYADPTPTKMSTAVSDMENAYRAAAETTIPAPTVELGGGTIAPGAILPPGVYKWGTPVTIPTGVTLKGGPDDVWIF